jgi:hypothetical protein
VDIKKKRRVYNGNSHYITNEYWHSQKKKMKKCEHMDERIVVSTERLVFLRKIISRLVEIICAHIIIINNKKKTNRSWTDIYFVARHGVY